MITWIQTALQKHHKVVFSILLVVITIAFVFTIGQIPFFGDRYRSEDTTKKDFYGFDLSNENTVQYLGTFAVYDALLKGEQPTNDFIIKQAYLRHMAGELGISAVTQKELLDYIHASPLFMGKDGKFDANRWKEFVAYRVSSGRMTEEDLTLILSENAMLDKVEKIIAGPGFVFDEDIQRNYDHQFGKWSFKIARIPYGEFNPEIKVTDADLEKFYADRAAAFKVGEGVVLETVFFPIKDFASVKMPGEAQLKTFYNANLSKYTDKDSKQLSFEAARAKVLADYLSDSAHRAASQKAEDLAMKIYNSKAKMNSAELKKLLAEEKVEVKRSKPMRTTDKQLDSSLPAQVAAAGFKLDELNFYTDPMPVDGGVYLVFLAQKLPSYQPKLSEVKKAVEEAYVSEQKRKLFAEYGKKLDAAFADGMKAGKTFEEVAKANKVKVESVRGLSMDKVLEASHLVKEALPVISTELLKLKVGGVSKMQSLGDAGYIVNLTSFQKPKVDAAQMNKSRENFEKGMSMATFGSVLRNASANVEIKE